MSDFAAEGASVVSLWRYPVKSMLGEELNASEITVHGLLGDRRVALRDVETGKIVGAKNPRKWANFFAYRAAFAEPPRVGSALPAVRITLPDGTVTTTESADAAKLLSAALGREVALEELPSDGDTEGRPWNATAEEYRPDADGLENGDAVVDFDLPDGTFFDLAVVHLLTTATLERLRAHYPTGRFEARRFRPNIVVDAGPDEDGFVENGWVGRTLAIGSQVRLRVTGPCPRCVMPTLAQADLPKDAGILRTAAQNNEANVGVYAAVEQGGAIRRGDAIELL